MAEEVQNAETTPTPKNGLMGVLMVPVIVGLISVVLGVTTAVIFPGVFGLEKAASAESPETPTFVYSFGDVVVNLNEGKMNRYLRLGISLMVEGDAREQKAFEEMIEKKKSLLTSWLLSYLADMSMEDVRGTAGQNRLRREIQNAFNETLFPDGDDRIQELLFEEFSIQ
jgi:flagellar basal body-associated protein FliL